MALRQLNVATDGRKRRPQLVTSQTEKRIHASIGFTQSEFICLRICSFVEQALTLNHQGR
jgi:hypothetical protein